ncbi:hypothetical protein G7Y79_00019g046220 [Physcia stellaris]|nr:hypothetical protein G7Y79_00019g046220 [Physcia stellaris]
MASSISFLLKSALILGGPALALASVLPCGDQVSLKALASGVVVPSGFWQIYQQDTQRSTNLFPNAPNGSAEFAVSQGSSATNQLDLIASFTNIPSGQGPYQIEFMYSNPARAGYGSGGNDVIDMFAVTGTLPTKPTWNNVDKLKGSLIGTFHLPRGDEDPAHSKEIFINSVTWSSTISLRFSITNDNSNAGFVRWTQNDDKDFFVPGLRIKYGG